MGGSLTVKSVETLRGDELPRLRPISANLACGPYARLADEGARRRHRAVDRQEDVRHCGVPVDAFLSVQILRMRECRWIQRWPPAPDPDRDAGGSPGPQGRLGLPPRGGRPNVQRWLEGRGR